MGAGGFYPFIFAQPIFPCLPFLARIYPKRHPADESFTFQLGSGGGYSVGVSVGVSVSVCGQFGTVLV